MNGGPLKIKIPAHELHDDNCVENWIGFIDELAQSIDLELLKKMGNNLAILRQAYENLKTPQEQSIWFRNTFSFLFNHAGQLSPRLFTYFQQCELLALASPIYWFDQLSSEDKHRVGDKLIEIIDKPDTPRRARFTAMLPYHLMNKAAQEEVKRLSTPLQSRSGPLGNKEIPRMLKK